MNWFVTQLRALLVGVMFLTRIPVPRFVGYSDGLLARSTSFFPLIGYLVGLFGAAIFILTSYLWPLEIAVWCSLAATIWLTGAFHEDGLGDTFDGIGGGWTRDQMLLIMKDSRMGTYGTVALIIVLGAKFLALTTLSASLIPVALLLGHGFGRWSSLPLIWRLPYVQHSGSKSKPFAASVTPLRLICGSLFTFASLALLAQQYWPWIVGSVLAITIIGGIYTRHKLGGITGDILGAINQLTELGVYLVLASPLID